MDSIVAAASDLKNKALGLVEELRNDPRIAELHKTVSALHSLEDLVGTARTEIPDIWGTAQQPGNATIQATTRPDEYYGLEPLEAAKRFLKKRGTSAPFAEIVAGIRRGGGDPGNEDKFRLSLTRSTFEIAKIGDLFGLLEFYPHIKRGTPGRKKKNGSGKEDPGAEDASADEQVLEEQVSDEKETPDVSASGDPKVKGDLN